MRNAPTIAPALSPPVRLQKRGPSPWVRRAVVFVACLLLADAIFGNRGAAEWVRARREYRRAVEGLAQVRQENAGLRDEARRLREDSAAIETVARRDLGLIKRGEILVRVKDRQ